MGSSEIKFRFIAGEKREDGIFARLDEGITPAIRKTLDMVDRNPKTDCFVGLSLLQFKIYFFATEVTEVKGGQHKTYFFKFPAKLLKTHRRKFIRIPFNEQFPAELRFQGSDGTTRTCKLKDLSREGMRLVISDTDKPFLDPGARLKLAVLKVINKEMSVGVQVVSHYPNNQVGLKIIAMSEEDKAWIKDCIRILMKQILNLPDSPFGDVLEKEPGKKD